MAAMLRDSTVVVVVVRTRPRAIPLAMIHMRKSIHGFPFVPLYGYGAPLGGRAPLLKKFTYTILFMKYYIYTSKMHNQAIQLSVFVNKVLFKYRIEKFDC